MTRLLAAALTVTALLLIPATGPAQADDALTRGDVETIVREYLIDNPDVIREALEELERREVEAANRARTEQLDQISEVLLNSTRQVELGNPDGDVTMVEFFDYNCGYCKRAMADMLKLMEQDPELRVVLKEFPVLGQGSVEAAQVAVAVSHVAPDAYLDFHKALMNTRGQANLASALAAAKDAGLDVAKVEAAIGEPEVNATIEEVYMLARRLGLNGTPAYVIGDEVLMGAVGFDRLKTQIDATRDCGETTC